MIRHLKLGQLFESIATVLKVHHRWFWLFTSEKRGRSGIVVKASDSGFRGRGFEPHSGRRVVSLSKIHLLPQKSTVNTQKAVAPSQQD